MLKLKKWLRENGIWTLDVNGDLNGTYYTYLVTNSGVEKSYNHMQKLLE